MLARKAGYEAMMKKKNDFDWTVVLAPFNEDVPAQKRTEIAIALSELALRIATHIICHTIVEHEDLFKEERMAIAHAFLQRETSTHMCNQKLTTEGLVYHYKEEEILLHEEYKTMTLTRSAYEHLAMFYFLYNRPRTEEERNVVWKYWQINSKKNMLDDDADSDSTLHEEHEATQREIQQLREEILHAHLNINCLNKLNEWTKEESRPVNGCIEFFMNRGRLDVRRISFSQAWKYLYSSEEMTLLYRHLSMHSHPVYNGLLQYQSQTSEDQGEDAIPLHLSSSFLAYMCKLFLQLIPQGEDIIKKDFSAEELFTFRVLSQLRK